MISTTPLQLIWAFLSFLSESGRPFPTGLSKSSKPESALPPLSLGRRTIMSLSSNKNKLQCRVVIDGASLAGPGPASATSSTSMQSMNRRLFESRPGGKPSMLFCRQNSFSARFVFSSVSASAMCEAISSASMSFARCGSSGRMCLIMSRNNSVYRGMRWTGSMRSSRRPTRFRASASAYLMRCRGMK